MSFLIDPSVVFQRHYGSLPSIISHSPAGFVYRLLVVDPVDLCVLQKEEKHGRVGAGEEDLR